MTLNSIGSLQQELQNMLGIEYNRYLENIRDWFGERVTKDFFDEKMTIILKEGALELHNELMKQIIFHCNGTPAPAPVLTFNNAKINPVSAPLVEINKEELCESGEKQIQNENRVLLYQSGNGEGSENQDYITVNLVDSDELMPYTTMEVEEQVDIKPIVPVDWLFNADVVTVSEDERNSTQFSRNVNYSHLTVEDNRYEIIRSPGIIPNVTHGYDIADRLNKLPHLKQHFKPQPKDQMYLSAGASIHGRFLLKAWECGMDGGVDHNCTQLVLEAVKEHIRKLVTEIVKQRRSFRMRYDKVSHSFGAPYPNPYLRQGQHLFDAAYCSETTKMADVMQIPKLLSNSEELDRIATLQIAAAAPPKNWRFSATRASLADFLNVIENDPGIIPYTSLRFKLLTGIGLKYKGFAGSFPINEEEDDNDFDDHNYLLPICSY